MGLLYEKCEKQISWVAWEKCYRDKQPTPGARLAFEKALPIRMEAAACKINFFSSLSLEDFC